MTDSSEPLDGGGSLLSALESLVQSLLDERRDEAGSGHPADRALIERQRAAWGRERVLHSLQRKFGERADDLIARMSTVADSVALSDDSARVRLAIRRSLAEVRDAMTERRKVLESELARLLRTDYLAADAWFEEEAAGLVTRQTYLTMRTQVVQDWVRTLPGQPEVDLDQARVIATTTGDVHVVARAGSGKTRVMVLRAAFLQLHCRVPGQQIMLVAFNKKAVEEILERLRGFLPGVSDLPLVVTFHALARAIVKPTERIVIEDNRQDHNLSEQVAHVVRELERERPDVVRRAMLAYYEEGCGPDESITSPRQGLDGTWYKSLGEVRIANVLFRRGVRYRYEKWFEQSKSSPDFSVLDRSGVVVLVIEFFGMQNDAGYDASKQRKLEFWGAHEGAERFLALHPEDVREQGRLVSQLEAELSAADLAWRYVTDDEVWAERRDQALKQFDQAIGRFIGFARKQRLTPSDVAGCAARHFFVSNAERLFVTLATEVFGRYLRRLEEEVLDDFDGIIERAITRIEGGRTTFTRESAGQRGDVSQLRFLQVDEMQDLSPLFVAMIDAVRGAAGSGLPVTGVGDDWQAINGFAGSDVRLFDAFKKRLPLSSQMTMQTNFRSSPAVVRTSNAIMSGLGEPGKAAGGEGEVLEFSSWARKHLASELMDPDVSALLGIVELALGLRGGNVAVLFRQENTRLRHGRSHTIDDLRRFMNKNWPSRRDRVELSTVHSYKGREATSVILVAPEDDFPLGHPAWFLTRVLGTSREKSIEEERRLLYVGVSRAVSDLYVFTPAGLRLTPLVVGRGTAIAPDAIHAPDPARPAQATSSVWPASGGVAHLEALGYRRTVGRHRWNLRGPERELDAAAHNALVGSAAVRVEIRNGRGDLLLERGVSERDAQAPAAAVDSTFF